MNALEIYGSNKIADELKFCIQEILKVCEEGNPEKLRNIVFKNGTTNAFPSVFAVIVLAFHETIVKEGKKVASYAGLKESLSDLAARVERGRKATSPTERRKNIDTVKGLIASNFILSENPTKDIYNDHKITDIEEIIRRSEIELANYELKQGLLFLKEGGLMDKKMICKIACTICAIANIGKNSSGKILIGVTDKPADATKAAAVDSVTPKKIGKRMVIGINREAKRLGTTVEKYISIFKTELKNSGLSSDLLSSVMSNLDYNTFYDLGVIVLSVPPQNAPSYVGDDMYWRNADSTELAKGARQIASISQRF